MEGREASDHFVQEASKAPPVDVGSMADFLDNFGCQVFRSAADGCGGLFVLEDLGKTEVGEFDVADAINDDVFGFEAEFGGSYSR